MEHYSIDNAYLAAHLLMYVLKIEKKKQITLLTAGSTGKRLALLPSTLRMAAATTLQIRRTLIAAILTKSWPN